MLYAFSKYWTLRVDELLFIVTRSQTNAGQFSYKILDVER